MEEKYFDYEDYIQKRLKEIGDLDERRYAKELLLEGLKGVFAWAEAKYGDLERRIQEEITLPWERFAVCTTIVERENYDPINSFWYPVWEEDLEKKENSWMETIYLMADERSCREFLEKGCGSGAIEGITESGMRVRFRVNRAARYEEGMRKLHALFSGSGIPWQTVHMGYLERFFDLVPEDGEEAIIGEAVRILWGKWENRVKQGFIPLWNIERIEAEPQEYRYPCLDEVIYEHVYYLKDDGDGYLAETGGDILSVRYEKNEMVVKTRSEEQKIISLYRLHQGNMGDSYGYNSPVLSNRKAEYLAARYLRRTGNFIQTPLELHRRVEELSGDYPIRLIGYEIRASGDWPEDLHKMAEILEGDMDDYNGSQVFPRDKRSILLFRFERGNMNKSGADENILQKDYLYESQIRYILSQLQQEFLEYRCVGVTAKL